LYSKSDIEAAVRQGIADAAGVSVDHVEVCIDSKEESTGNSQLCGSDGDRRLQESSLKASAAPEVGSTTIIHMKYAIHHPANSAVNLARLLQARGEKQTGAYIERAFHAAGIKERLTITDITAVVTTAAGTKHAIEEVTAGGQQLVVNLHVLIVSSFIALHFQ